ncbi:hypothetical protein [Cellulomonas alba]|uniref:Fibronectin type-III domain-containing protein n=1 Tax=Cellulomonas alba TaxID=3053467 RepID=A0ABT7SB96_9CELL|nr:hypothetical protein [Cellulomonas alba]MDM7853468.1 hypothetical protein [Cellulomonas alba]
MLTLAGSSRVAGATVYRDVSWADGGRAVTSRFYVLPDELALAATPTSAGWTFYRYRGAPGTTDGGGLLVLTLALLAPEGVVDAVRAAYGLASDAAVEVAPPPVSASAARVSFAGESGGGELVTSVSAAGGAAGLSAVVVLTQDGAALVDQAVDQGLGALHVELDLAVSYVLDDLELTVWCDVQASAQVASDLAAAGQAGPAALTAELVARQLAGTTLRTARPLSADEQAAVEALSTQVLQSVVLPRLLDDGGAPRPQSSGLEQRADLTLTASAPGVLPVTRSANLALPDGPAHTVSSDLGGAGLRRVVRVSAVGDLAAYGIGVVTVHLEHAGVETDGTAVRRAADVELRPDAPAAVAVFDLASADQRLVHAHVAVHFTDASAPYELDLPPTDADSVDLDVDALGVIVVDLALVSPDPDGSVQAVVDLAYGDDGGPIEGRYVLDGSQPTARWSAVVREPPRPYRYRVTWVDGASRTEGDWASSAHQVLRLVPPVAAPAGTVTVISAGDFDQLSALVVELQAADDQPVTTLTFTAPDQAQTWTTAPRAGGYRARTTLVRPDGAHSTGPSVTADQPVLVVRDTLRLDVTVVPALLGVGTAVSRAVVELESPDHAAAHATVVFDPPAAAARAALRLADPAAREYRYRLTLCPPSQPPRVGDWQSASSTVLVPVPMPVTTP